MGLPLWACVGVTFVTKLAIERPGGGSINQPVGGWVGGWSVGWDAVTCYLHENDPLGFCLFCFLSLMAGGAGRLDGDVC